MTDWGERFWDAYRVARHSPDPASVQTAIEYGRQALAAAGGDERTTYLRNLGGLLQTRFHQTGDLSYLREAVDGLLEAVLLTADRPAEEAAHANNLGMVLHTAFQHNRDPATLDDAVWWSRQAVEGAAPEDKADYQDNLVVALLTVFTVTGDEDALREGIEQARDAARHAPDAEITGRSLHFLAVLLRRWFSHTGDPAVLPEAVDAARRAVELTPAGSADHLDRLAHLCVLLDDRHRLTGTRDDLAELVEARTTLVAITPPGDPRYSRFSTNLLFTQREWTALTGERPERAGHVADRAGVEAEMSGLLAAEFGRTRNPELLERAVRHGRAAIAATPAGHPHRAERLDHLAAALAQRGEAFGDRAALTESVELQREAVRCAPSGDPRRPRYLGNLAVTLNTLFLATGELALLTEAIDAARAAAATTAGHPDHPVMLANLAATLHRRFRVTGELRMLTDALDAARESVRLGAGRVAGHARHLGNLATMLSDWFERTGRAAALDEAIRVHRAAADATPAGHPDRALRLANLGGALGTAYARFGDQNALREAIAARRASVAAAAEGSPERAGYVAGLAGALCDWSARPGAGETDPAILDEAVALAREAVRGREGEAFSRTTTLSTLADALRLRFRRSGDRDALTEALDVYREAALFAGSPTVRRVEAAERWGELAAEGGLPATAAEGYAVAVGLLPQLAGRRLDRGDAQYWLGRFAGLAADAAACALNAGDPEGAVTVLESGRCVLAAQALDSRGDLSELRERAPGLAAEFEALGAEFETDTTRDRLALAAELEALAVRIRELPGLDRFLRPPSLDDLTAQAHEGPVVYVNVSRYRCDAVILTPDGVRARPLPDLTEDALRQRVRAFRAALAAEPGERQAAERTIHDTLEWLWDTVAGPVLDAIGVTGSRIWWAPVGVLSLLPLHAAGHHRGGGPAVMDRVISSVTPTVRALAHARTRRRGSGERPRLLVVAMPSTPDGADLPGARAEAEFLAAHVPGATVLAGADATRDAVLDALPSAGWVHFACHGYSDPDNPSDSHLVLHDHARAPLRVVDVSRLRLPDARFAYLSACDTARTSETLSDEAIHPAAAFQIAGFAQVVGTLWRVEDAVAPVLAQWIYRDLLTPGAGTTATAVHRTARALREKYPNLPSVWAAHVHFGA
ncbi:CHAT domain-containing protein [Amycolatopsis thermalba]|uniref:CHAT domain-containing protein n=1 Tax=Amycolatopsis thermalba TaxID=944492 RepID=A0ABY4NYM2_9PSEU|nr:MULTISPECIES: CHAT domain-containing protein [Amycolatopsis]UQS25189.1 CHAT domain-containing protein [Amycolatopsis thermalba]